MAKLTVTVTNEAGEVAHETSVETGGATEDDVQRVADEIRFLVEHERGAVVPGAPSADEIEARTRRHGHR